MRRESGNPAARTNAGVRASVAGPSGGVSAEIVDEVGQDQSFLDVHAALHNAVATGWPRSVGAGWMPSVPRIVFTTGSALYVLAYLGFAIGGHGLPLLIGSFAPAGAGIGLAETAESALVARMLPDRLRGSGFGLFGGVEAAGDLPASAVVGLVYTAFSPLVGFGYGAGWMVPAAVVA
jgi:hypothetical protein